MRCTARSGGVPPRVSARGAPTEETQCTPSDGEAYWSRILAHLLLGMFVAGAGSASAAAAIETMPLWRVQVVITTGADGTDGNPALRFNGTTSGVRTLNPPARTAFDAGHVDSYDLRLFGSPSEMTMLRVGIAGSDSWCVKKIELRFNGRTAFVGGPTDGTCAPVGAGSYLEYSSADLRNNTFWKNYGTPPALPSQMSALDLRALVRDVTGSAMLARPGVHWDASVPLTVVRTSNTTIHVTFGLRISDPDGVEPPNTMRPSYVLRLYVGSDGRLHASLLSWSFPDGTIQPVVTQLDTALSRMTARPAPHDPLRFGVDALTNIAWSYTPVLAP